MADSDSDFFDSFDRLPDSLLLLIFNSLSDVKSLLRCRSLSKHFNSLIPQTDSLHLTIDCVISSDSFFIGFFKSILKSFFDLISPTQLHLESPQNSPTQILRQFDRIRSLEIDFCVGILFAVFLLVFIPPAANFHRRREVEKKFLKYKNNLTVSVKRGEIQQLVSVSDVKVGDKVYLKEGDHLPADGLFIEGQNMILDEVRNPKFDCDQNPCLFSGSVVKRGNGTMIVVSTGADTALGKGLIDVAVN